MDNSALSIMSQFVATVQFLALDIKTGVAHVLVQGLILKDNRKIDFYNIDPTGGFQSVIEGENKHGSEHECYIFKNGDKYHCYADEARFGGIVVKLTK